ncbi:MAG: flagellar hook-associated protein FlgK [Bryobacteraceae bacterium]
MSSLFATLQNAASTLNVFDKAIGVVQNNVSNSSTPGYAVQQVNLVDTLLGGVASGPIGNSRSDAAEQSVWNRNAPLGAAMAEASNLASIQSQFDVTGQSGIPAALSALYSSFSSFSTSPSDTPARNGVISAAQQVVQKFNQLTSSLQSSVQQVNQQLSSSVSQINQVASKIVAINVQMRNGGTSSGLQTQLYNALQQLSNLTPISVNVGLNGTVTVLMNGQVPLVSGDAQTQLQVSYPSFASPAVTGGMPTAHIETSRGQDVTSLSGGGQLGGLLQVRNSTLPALIGDENQQGSLNQLAQSLADRVNSILTAGQVSAGPPAVSGTPLFSYDTSKPSAVASTLSLDPNITASTLAAIQPGPPVVGNGAAAQLAALQDPSSSADKINGLSYTSFYSQIASDLGTQASGASEAQSTQTDLLNQADGMRTQISGVSLDEQAAQLLQYQQAYQASSKLISVVNDMMQTLMDMVR